MILLAVRPRRIPTWLWPVAGALVMIVLGYEPASAAIAAVVRQWNILCFIAGLMCVAAAAEESGAFELITHRILAIARGSRRRLFVYLFLAGALLTIVLSNDATAIVLTPIIYRVVAGRADPMPYLFSSIFVADTASFGTPFSNPANVLILPHPRLAPYLWHLGPPELIAIAINLGLFLFFFRNEIRGEYEAAAPVALQPRALWALGAFGAIGCAYVAAVALSVPLGPVALIGGVVALAVARVRPAAAARHAGWGTFALLAGLFALLDAVSRGGFTAWALRGLDDAMRYGAATVIVASASGAALLSSLLNNLPIAVVSANLVERAASPNLAYPLIAGVDLGPNLTTTGSLATILWLAILQERGVRVSFRRYVRLGAIVVPATLGVTLLWLTLVR